MVRSFPRSISNSWRDHLSTGIWDCQRRSTTFIRSKVIVSRLDTRKESYRSLLRDIDILLHLLIVFPRNPFQTFPHFRSMIIWMSSRKMSLLSSKLRSFLFADTQKQKKKKKKKEKRDERRWRSSWFWQRPCAWVRSSRIHIPKSRLNPR